MTSTPPVLTATLSANLSGRDGVLHDVVTSAPWVGWLLVSLLVVMVLLSSVRKLTTRPLHRTPWWARIGLFGILAYAWHRSRQSNYAHTDQAV